MSDPIDLPSEAPVMPLPGGLLFPHALLPLYIFEPRYRAMLAHALCEQRMFCVALIAAKRGEWRTTADFCQIASVGLIRACVGRGDGTSNLILQGLHRVRFTGFVRDQPFPVATIQRLHSVAGKSPVATEALGRKVLELYARFRGTARQLPEKVHRHLSDLNDPEMLADLMAATFITDSLRRQQLLEELSIDQRLRLVIQYLGEESGDAAA